MCVHARACVNMHGYVSMRTRAHAHTCTYERVFACRSMNARVKVHVYGWVIVCECVYESLCVHV